MAFREISLWREVTEIITNFAFFVLQPNKNGDMISSLCAIALICALSEFLPANFSSIERSATSALSAAYYFNNYYHLQIIFEIYFRFWFFS